MTVSARWPVVDMACSRAWAVPAATTSVAFALTASSAVSALLAFLADLCPERSKPPFAPRCPPPRVHPPNTLVWVSGQPTHPSHRFIIFRGLAVCYWCYSRASVGILNLARPCTPGPRSHRLSHGFMLAGMSHWLTQDISSNKPLPKKH